jgi:hypothetical protein
MSFLTDRSLAPRGWKKRPIIKSRCAHLQESDRTLRDGYFEVVVFQALRATLRSPGPFGTTLPNSIVLVLDP